jgi:phthiodiolone/phenolphthiodiolone dimycocerosates ketoreductase
MEGDEMSGRPVEIAMPLQLSRWFPASMTLDLARALESTGAVDYLHGWDQLAGWWPPELWSPEYTPVAAITPDSSSFPNWTAMLSAAAAVAPGLGTVLAMDSIRRGPAETMQMMLTMAGLTEGKAQFHMGAGEIHNTKPFGWRRSGGFQRYEDLFEIFALMWESDGPVNFQGNVWTLDRAWIGDAKPFKPQVWGLGGGPRIIDVATSYADGFGTLCRQVAYSPERVHEMVSTMREQLERKGRDPDAFGFGLYATMVLHEDDDVIDAGLDNPLLQWMTATFGRVTMSDWDREGIEPPMPRDWHYSMKNIPLHVSKAEALDICSRVTPAMNRAAWFRGTPKDVAVELAPYIEAGATWISIIDMLPAVLDPAEGEKAMGRSLELAALLKGLGTDSGAAAGSGASASASPEKGAA